MNTALDQRRYCQTLYDNRKDHHHISDNNNQVIRLDEINQLQKKWLIVASEVAINERRNIVDISQDFPKIISSIEQGTGKAIIDKIRLIIDNFILEE